MRRAIQILTTSGYIEYGKRGTVGLDIAKKLFEDYHAQVIQPKYSGERPVRSVEDMRASYPFLLPKMREGEPPRIVYPVAGKALIDLRNTDEAEQAEHAYFAWANQEPDGQLLIHAQISMFDWLIREGVASPEYVLSEWNIRWKQAEAYRAEGIGTILDTHWSSNLELRQPPPKFPFEITYPATNEAALWG